MEVLVLALMELPWLTETVAVRVAAQQAVLMEFQLGQVQVAEVQQLKGIAAAQLVMEMRVELLDMQPQAVAAVLAVLALIKCQVLVAVLAVQIAFLDHQ